MLTSYVAVGKSSAGFVPEKPANRLNQYTGNALINDFTTSKTIAELNLMAKGLACQNKTLLKSLNLGMAKSANELA